MHAVSLRSGLRKRAAAGRTPNDTPQTESTPRGGSRGGGTPPAVRGLRGGGTPPAVGGLPPAVGELAPAEVARRPSMLKSPSSLDAQTTTTFPAESHAISGITASRIWVSMVSARSGFCRRKTRTPRKKAMIASFHQPEKNPTRAKSFCFCDRLGRMNSELSSFI